MLEMHSEDAPDLIDSVLSPAYIAASFATTGLATITLFGVGLSDVLVSSSGSEVSIAMVVGILTIVVAYVTNEPDLDDLEGAETWVPMLGVLSMIFVGLVPALHDLVVGSAVFGLPVVVFQAAAFYYVAYK